MSNDSPIGNPTSSNGDRPAPRVIRFGDPAPDYRRPSRFAGGSPSGAPGWTGTYGFGQDGAFTKLSDTTSYRSPNAGGQGGSRAGTGEGGTSCMFPHCPLGAVLGYFN